jgi:outer membrane protein insertion porin family
MNLTFALEIIGSFGFRQVSRVFSVGALLLLLNSCSSTRYLQENQKLLYRQTVVAPRHINKDNLQDLYTQKSARKIFGVPMSLLGWMYHKGEKNFNKQKFIDRKEKKEKKFDRKIAKAKNPRKKDNLEFRKKKKQESLDNKIENGNLFMQWGDKTAVYDSAKLPITVAKMNNYLFIKGYFNGKVEASVKEKGRMVSLVYNVIPGKPYLIDSLLLRIPDQKVLDLLTSDLDQSNIKKGEQYDQEKLTKERERIDGFLKDRGYYDFSRQYIDFQIDTVSKGNQQIILVLEVNNPQQTDHHRQFKIDSISFTTDVGVKAITPGLKRINDPYENITFNYYNYQFSRKILASRVFLKKDSLYSRAQTFRTQRQMANLDVFKFVNVNYDTSGGRFIANIFASPLERYAWSNEAGATVTQGFPGPYVSSNLKWRNLFGGLEILELNGRYGYEGVASATEKGNFYQSTEAIGSASITFPRFLFPLSKAAVFRYAKYNPRTRLSGSYTYTDRPEYQRSITNISASFLWDFSQKLRFTFTPTSLNIINSTLTKEFRDQLTTLQQTQGNNLINAFNPSFVGSMILSITWNDDYGSTKRNSNLIRGTIESGGTLLNLYTPQIIINQGLEPYQFIRLSLDYRRNTLISKTASFSYRINTGFGLPYSNNQILPYEKNFFSGGSNSVRAWRPRRLGIGSEPPPLSGSPVDNPVGNPDKDGYFNYQFEKPGEILIEGSVEWRQKLFGFVNYALFLDAGNVWANRPGASEAAQFKTSTFLSEFGVGTGFGLRFDFNFLILRLDVGMKVWDPARPSNDRFVLGNTRFLGPYGKNSEPVIYNIGIGYPF